MTPGAIAFMFLLGFFTVAPQVAHDKPVMEMPCDECIPMEVEAVAQDDTLRQAMTEYMMQSAEACNGR